MPNEYYVTKDGVPCKILKEDFVKHGVLVKCEADEKALPLGTNYSAGKRKAMRAITRTLKEQKKWRDSILSDWARVKKITEPGIFLIEKRPCSTT